MLCRGLATLHEPDRRRERPPHSSVFLGWARLNSYSIVAGSVHIDDIGDLVPDANVAENIEGEKKLQDWYSFDHAGGAFRLDLRHQSYTNSAFNDLDVYLFRIEAGGALTFVNRSTNDPTMDGERESIVSAFLPAGTYVVAIQAWATPTERVEYWYVVR